MIEVINANNQKEQMEAIKIMTVNGKPVKIKLDTRGEVDAMPRKVFDLIKAENKTPSETSTNLGGYDGINILLQEITKESCVIDNNKEEIRFYMSQTHNKTLISLKKCKKLNFIKVLGNAKSQ